MDGSVSQLKKVFPEELVFGAINFIYYSLAFARYSVITLVSYGLLSVLIGAFIYAKTGRSASHVEDLYEHVKHSMVQAATPFTALLSECHAWLVTKLDRTLKTENPFVAIEACMVLFLVAQLGKYISVLTLAWAVLVWLFTWPAIYSRHTAAIDQRFDEFVRQFKAKTGKLSNETHRIVEQLKLYREDLIPEPEKKNQ